jgi:prepilin-type processing-associated H-X9-DG protein
VELLAVIGIVGILAALVMMSVGNARRSARTLKCGGNLRQIAQITLLYTSEHRNTLPRLYAANWVADLWPYIDNRTYVPFYTNDLPAILAGTIFECPDADLDTTSVKRSYGANLQIAANGGSTALPLSTVSSPAATVMFTDSLATSSLSVTALNPRHNQKFNAVFFDGHVKLLPKSGNDILDTSYRSAFWRSQ